MASSYGINMRRAKAILVDYVDSVDLCERDVANVSVRPMVRSLRERWLLAGTVDHSRHATELRHFLKVVSASDGRSMVFIQPLQGVATKRARCDGLRCYYRFDDTSRLSMEARKGASMFGAKSPGPESIRRSLTSASQQERAQIVVAHSGCRGNGVGLAWFGRGRLSLASPSARAHDVSHRVLIERQAFRALKTFLVEKVRDRRLVMVREQLLDALLDLR